MTDAEIIKALECHADTDIKTCKICPYDGQRMCGHQLCRDGLDLINRQKAEIEALDFLIKESNKIAERQDKEIERLTVLAKLGNMRANDYRAMRDKCKTAKSEAIKEFAEKVKASRDVLFNNIYSGFHFNVIIDSLVKEMVGDTE
jgi:hypothetical protein